MSAFSGKLKNARIICGYSIKDAVIVLRNAGVQISEKTLYNWESGARTPDADEFIQICDAYGIKSFDQFDGLLDEETRRESEMIAKYRMLDDRGKNVVETVIANQWSYLEVQKERSPSGRSPNGLRLEDNPQEEDRT